MFLWLCPCLLRAVSTFLAFTTLASLPFLSPPSLYASLSKYISLLLYTGFFLLYVSYLYNVFLFSQPLCTSISSFVSLCFYLLQCECLSFCHWVYLYLSLSLSLLPSKYAYLVANFHISLNLRNLSHTSMASSLPANATDDMVVNLTCDERPAKMSDLR